MSDIKDEIDWEFPGDTVMQGQTNYFWEGVIREWCFVFVFVFLGRASMGFVHMVGR